MKIGSKIKPKSGRPRHVTIHGKDYMFAPVNDKDDVVHFVADVTNEAHVDVLIGSGDFYVYGKALDKQPTLSRANPPSGEGAGGGEGKLDGDPPKPLPYDPETIEAATKLLKGSIGDVGREVANHKLKVIRAAVEIEKASETQRKGMVTLLEQTLEGAKQAGIEE